MAFDVVDCLADVNRNHDTSPSSNEIVHEVQPITIVRDACFTCVSIVVDVFNNVFDAHGVFDPLIGHGGGRKATRAAVTANAGLIEDNSNHGGRVLEAMRKIGGLTEVQQSAGFVDYELDKRK